MHRSITRFWRVGAAALTLWAMLFEAASPIAAASLEDVSVPAPNKRFVALGDGYETADDRRMANVLFYLDTTSAMVFSPKAFPPSVVLADGYDVMGPDGNYPDNAADWQKTHDTYGYGRDAAGAKAAVIDRMKYATFGTGALPAAALDDGLRFHLDGDANNIYGRDVDESNNFKYDPSWTIGEIIEHNRDNYYFPYLNVSADDDALTATYGADSGSNTMLELYAKSKSFVDLHKQAYDGDTSKCSYDYSKIPLGWLPYAMIFKNPEYWQKPPSSFTQSDLVPNDSRMYRMKAALWQVLDNAANFDDIRFAMATPFASTNRDLQTSNNNSSAIKHYPYGTKDSGDLREDAERDILAPYVNGTMAFNETGQGYSHRLRHADGAAPAVWGDSTIPMVYPDRGTEMEQRRFILGTRAYLRLPFAERAHKWTAPGGGTISHLNKFRLWIDGVEDITDFNEFSTIDYIKGSPKGHYLHPNPELRPTVMNAHSRSIAPRNDAEDPAARYVWYSLRRDDSADAPVAYGRYTGVIGRANVDLPSTSIFIRGSGEAAGTLLDFFSPSEKWESKRAEGNIESGTVSPAATVRDLDPVSFPIKDVRDDNWVIMIVAGHDVPRGQTYTAEQAIGNLYDMTDASQGRTVTMIDELNADGSIKSLKQGKLKTPVRTIVIGLIAEPDKDAGEDIKSEHKEAIARLHRMARAGQPKAADAKAYIAGTAGELRDAIESALAHIRSNIETPKPAERIAAQTEGRAMAGAWAQDEAFNTYVTSYTVLDNNQWRGELRRYASVKDDKGELSVVLKGKLSDGIKPNRRNLRYWSPSRSKFVGLDLVETEETRKESEFAQMTNIKYDTMGTSRHGQWEYETQGCAPATSMLRWYLGYDQGNGLFERSHLLSDFGQSVPVVLEPPSASPSLPGFKEWAETQQDIKPTIYAQTNDGLLLVVDAETMTEKAALIPPPTLLPDRMISLKADMPTSSVPYKTWIDVDEEERPLDTKQARRSNAVFTLDGHMQKRYFNLKNSSDPNDWGAYLIATLGRGGNGIYMMDVTDPDDPRFMWHRENIVIRAGNRHAPNVGRLSDTIQTVEWDSKPGQPDRVDVIAEGKASIINFQDHCKKTHDGTNDGDTNWWAQLGFNIPRPALGVVGNYDAGSRTYDMQNVIVLPGGMKSTLHTAVMPGMVDSRYKGHIASGLDQYNGGEGAALFVIDPKDGSILRVFNSASFPKRKPSKAGTHEPVMGMMVSEPTLYANAGTRYMASRAFAADNLGRIFMVDFGKKVDGVRVDSKDPRDWSIKVAASLQIDRNRVLGNFSIPSGVALSAANGQVWLAGGTADVGTKGVDTTVQDDVVYCSLSSGGGTYYQQLLFAFGMDKEDLDDEDEVNAEQFRGTHWKELKPDDPNSTLGPSDGKTGWYIELAAREARDETYEREYVTSRPVIADGKLFASTFWRDKDDPDGGVSRLYALDLTTGAPILWEGDIAGERVKYREFRGVKITGMTLSTNGGRKTLVVTYDKISDTDADSLIGGDDKISKVHGDDISSLTIDLGRPAVKNRLKPGTSVMEYWLVK